MKQKLSKRYYAKGLIWKYSILFSSPTSINDTFLSVFLKMLKR